MRTRALRFLALCTRTRTCAPFWQAVLRHHNPALAPLLQLCMWHRCYIYWSNMYTYRCKFKALRHSCLLFAGIAVATALLIAKPGR